MEVKETNGVDREIVEISQVFCNDDFPVGLRHSRQLLEKLNAFAKLPDFVRGKESQSGVEGAIRKRQLFR